MMTMDKTVKAVLEACTTESDAERVTFGEVVMKLMGAGVERYHADLLRAEKIYYMPDGESALTPCHALDAAPAEEFAPRGVDAAVRAIQHGEIKYREFCARIAQAGCVGYLVSLAGHRAVYYGRTGETHVEMFPGAK
jgi:uncharacterized protein YbcV (DUF1398 family)